MALSVALTLLPIVLIVFLMVNRRFAADTSGVIGWLATLLHRHRLLQHPAGDGSEVFPGGHHRLVSPCRSWS